MIWAWGSIEADFLRFYDMDLNYVHTNNLITWRKFCLLVRELPEDSAYNHFLNNKENKNLIRPSDIDSEISNIKKV